MSTVFAFNFFEEMDSIEVRGYYDPDLQLWVEKVNETPVPVFSAEASAVALTYTYNNTFSHTTTNTFNTQTSTGFFPFVDQDSDPDTDPDFDPDTALDFDN
jgi:hypothetical protein